VARVFSGGGADCFNIDDSGLASIWLQRLPRAARAAVGWGLRTAESIVPRLQRRHYPYHWADMTGLPTSVYPPIMADHQRLSLYQDADSFKVHLRELRDVLSRTVSAFDHLPDVDVWRWLDMQTFCAESMNFWISAWSRANDISLIDPYFDLDLTDYLMQVSPSGYGKRYLREIAATMMPRAHAYRAKIAQTIPIGQWMRGPLKPMVMDHLTASRVGDIFRFGEIQRLVDQHMKGEKDWTWTIWGLLTLVKWRETLGDAPRVGTVVPGRMDNAILPVMPAGGLSGAS
jgi:asparagine synthase (glutamine-hydrolysing)